MEALVVPQQELMFVRTNFTKEQKKWVLQRDNYQCQHDSEHEHQGNLQVHHLIAQMYAQAWLGLGPDVINSASNALVVCEGIHVGVDLRREPHPDLLHPDQFQARREYAQNRNSFAELSGRHRELALQGIKYWNATNDDRLMLYAMWRTEQELRAYNRPFPKHYGK